VAKKKVLAVDRKAEYRKITGVRQAILDRLAEIGWSRHRLAQEIRMRVVTVYDALGPGGNPRLDTIERMAEAVGLRITVAPDSKRDSKSGSVRAVQTKSKRAK
jgi:hypothetical protein